MTRENMVRKATKADIPRIAEIIIFGKRVAYRPIFQDDVASFNEFLVVPLAEEYQTDLSLLENMFVYDDGIIKGVVNANPVTEDEVEISEFYAEPFFKGQGIGRALLEEVIKKGIADFWRPRMDPTLDEVENICFKVGKKPAVGKSYNWWRKKARKFNLGRKSRLGTKSEYIAFLGVLIKELVAEGWSKKDAWHAVCNDSRKLGHYYNSENGKHDFEPTGSRAIAGFYDLANTCKILVEDEYSGAFLLAGGYSFYGSDRPLAELGRSHLWDRCLSYSVGWIVLEC